MIKKNKMKQQMVKRISALMLNATLCVSACPNVATGQELTETETTQQEGTKSPSIDNSVEETTSAKLKGLQILLNGTTITSGRIDVKKGDTVTVRAEIENEDNVKSAFLSVGAEELIIDLTKGEHGYFEGTAVCEEDLGNNSMLFYLNYTIYGSTKSLTEYYKEIGTDQEENTEDNKDQNTENNTQDKTETSEIKVKDIQVSNKEVVISDNTLTNSNNTDGACITITISLEGKLEKKKPLEVTYGTSDFTITEEIYNGISTNTFVISIDISYRNLDDNEYDPYKTGTYEIKSLKIDGKELAYNGDKTLFTLKDNRTDKTAPVVNAMQVYVNDKLQTGTTFTVKKGDIVKAYLDVTDENQVAGGYVTLTGTSEGNKYLHEVINVKPSEYDLEGQIEIKDDYENMEYTISQVECWDLNNNWANYYKAEDIESFYKEVKVENAGVVKNDTALKDVVAKLDELIKLEGALDEYMIPHIEQAKKEGKEITADISLATIPEKSIDSKVKEGVQAKAKEALGEDVKVAYLDISLNLLADGFNIGNVNKLVEPIGITIKLPENLKGNYDYKVIRYHENADGTTDIAVLDAVKNADGTITFKTDRFSTYAIAYSASEETGNNNQSGNENGTGTGTGNNSPVTGQTGMLALYFAVVVSGLGIFAVSKKRVQK